VSWNRIVFYFVSIVVLFFTPLQAKKMVPLSDDALIVQGLLYDEYKAYENARQVYATLFNRTKAEVYLFKEATASLLGRTHVYESIKRLKAWDNTHEDTPEVQRLLIPLYLTVNQVGSAKIQAEYLLERSTNPLDIELASNPFLYSGEFQRALKLLSKVYEAMPREEILLRMADIMDEYTNERERAIQLLETHRRMNITSKDVLAKLLVMYSKEQDINGLLDTYKALYVQEKDEKILAKIIEAYAYKRDILGAIAFLEEHKIESMTLYEFYKSKRLFEKAFKFAEKKYTKNKDARWIAEKGILLFEKAEDKDDKKMIDEVLSHFSEAISLGVDDSIYLNYYGYTLIDKEVDVKKGIKIIEDALKQQPDNTYYLDSLAWGYYKEGLCSKAYKLMKRVVDEEGLEEQEIIDHWLAIKQCK
jgi:tetratricopeptide (TPR) repeat protein